MAIAKQGSKVTAKLTDLSQETAFNNGDRIVFWCNSTGEASTLDYANLKIDLEHTTFKATFNQVVAFTSSASLWVSSMTETLDSVNNKTDALIENNTNTQNEIAALKMLVKMLLGIASTRNDGEANFAEKAYTDAMNSEAQALYQETKQDVLDATGEDGFDFKTQNVTYLTNVIEDLETRLSKAEAKIATLQGG